MRCLIICDSHFPAEARRSNVNKYEIERRNAIEKSCDEFLHFEGHCDQRSQGERKKLGGDARSYISFTWAPVQSSHVRYPSRLEEKCASKDTLWQLEKFRTYLIVSRLLPHCLFYGMLIGWRRNFIARLTLSFFSCMWVFELAPAAPKRP